MEYYNTKTTREEIENGVADEFGVIYSKDGKRLLESSKWEMENYVVHPGTEVICDKAFKSAGWVQLNGITFPDSLKAIGNEAFVLTILNHISLPHGLISIGEKAFLDSHLISIELPETLESIGDYAFEMNDGLQSIKIPSSVIHIGLAPLAECNHLKKISVDKNNQYFVEKDGLLSDYKQTRIIQVVPSNTKNLQLPNTFMYCDTGAFSSIANLDFIPKKFKGRWLLQSYKEHILRIIDRPCGVLDIGTQKYTNIVSLKFSNSLYCNIIESQVRNKSVLLIGDNLGVNVLLSALSFTKKKIKIYTQVATEVLITKKNYKDYVGSYLSEDLTVKKSFDVVNEETGEVEELIIDYPILERDTELTKGLLEELLDEYDDLNAILDANGPGVNHRNLFGPILRYKEVNQSEAIERLQKEAPHLMLLPYFIYNEDIGKAIIDGWERFERLQYEGFSDKVYLDNCWPNACPEDDINWIGLVEDFFYEEGLRIGTDVINPKRLWSDMKTFFLSKNIPDDRVEQFTGAFSHLSFNKSLVYKKDTIRLPNHKSPYTVDTMEYYNTKVTEEEIANGIEDEFGVLYSKDGKKLLKCKNPKLRDYTVKNNTEIICDDAFFVKVKSDPGFYLNAREIILPDSLKVIGKGSFSCLLDKIELPKGLLCIKDDAFTNIESSFILPDSLLYIGDYAFGGYMDLEEIKIPKSVHYIGKAPFTNFKKIVVDKRNKYFTTYHGLLCDKDLTRIIQAPVHDEHKLNIPSTILTCDCGAFSKGKVLNAIPEKFIYRWKLDRMKEILSTLINGSCGITDFFIHDIGQITTIKLSDSLYCNMTAAYNRYGNPTFLVGKQLNLLTFFNALGFKISDIGNYLNIFEEVVLTKENYSQYLDRRLAQDVGSLYVEYEEFDEEFVNEETGEIEKMTSRVPRKEGYLDNILNQANFKDIIDHGGLEEPLTISLLTRDCFDKGSVYFTLKEIEDKSQEEAVNLIKKNAPHLLSNFIFTHRKEIFHALVDAANRHDNKTLYWIAAYSQEEQFKNNAFICMENEDVISWSKLIDQFFTEKIKRIRSGRFTYKNCWQLLEKYLISKGIPNEFVHQFVRSFSFIFTQFAFSITDPSFFTFLKKTDPALYDDE